MHLTGIEFLFLAIAGCYSLTVLVVSAGWFALDEGEKDVQEDLVTVSVIVAARNESHTLPFLLEDLHRQEYPARFFDIIIVDDHSDERVSDLEQVISFPGNNLTVHIIPGNMQGKKQALLEGVKLSHSELIVFTDADCRVGPGWITSFVHQYNAKASPMIIGLVDYKPEPGISQAFFRTDLLSLVVCGAGTASLGFPTICNGSNMAVRRNLYLEQAKNLKKNLLSGDDVFLLHGVKRSEKKAISAIKSKDNLVRTQPPENLNEFFNQRARWISKGRSYNDPHTIALALLVILANLSFVLAVLFCISGAIQFRYAIAMYLMKLSSDSLILAAGFVYFGGKKTLLFIPVFELLYPFYILIAIFMGMLSLFSWKKRKQVSTEAIQPG